MMREKIVNHLRTGVRKGHSRPDANKDQYLDQAPHNQDGIFVGMYGYNRSNGGQATISIEQPNLKISHLATRTYQSNRDVDNKKANFSNGRQFSVSFDPRYAFYVGQRVAAEDKYNFLVHYFSRYEKWLEERNTGFLQASEMRDGEAMYNIQKDMYFMSKNLIKILPEIVEHLLTCNPKS